LSDRLGKAARYARTARAPADACGSAGTGATHDGGGAAASASGAASACGSGGAREPSVEQESARAQSVTATGEKPERRQPGAIDKSFRYHQRDEASRTRCSRRSSLCHTGVPWTSEAIPADFGERCEASSRTLARGTRVASEAGRLGLTGETTAAVELHDGMSDVMQGVRIRGARGSKVTGA
jgi:hypothetical protein